MDDLAAFITARLDEDEAIARAAGSDQWAEHSGDVVSAPLANGDYGPGGYWVASASFACEGEAEPLHDGHAAHIARHDPARVLREVAAGRAMVTQVVQLIDSMDAQINQECGPDHYYTPTGESLMVLKLLALPYSDHPGYRAEWAPRDT